MLIFNISTVSTQLFLKSRESRKVAQKTYLEKKKFGLRRSFHLEVNLPYLTPQQPRAISRTYTAYTPRNWFIGFMNILPLQAFSGDPQGSHRRLRKGYRSCHSPTLAGRTSWFNNVALDWKRKIHTSPENERPEGKKNDAFREKVDSFERWLFLVSISDFWGVFSCGNQALSDTCGASSGPKLIFRVGYQLNATSIFSCRFSWVQLDQIKKKLKKSGLLL